MRELSCPPTCGFRPFCPFPSTLSRQSSLPKCFCEECDRASCSEAKTDMKRFRNILTHWRPLRPSFLITCPHGAAGEDLNFRPPCALIVPMPVGKNDIHPLVIQRCAVQLLDGIHLLVQTSLSIGGCMTRCLKLNVGADCVVTLWIAFRRGVSKTDHIICTISARR